MGHTNSRSPPSQRRGAPRQCAPPLPSPARRHPEIPPPPPQGQSHSRLSLLSGHRSRLLRSRGVAQSESKSLRRPRRPMRSRRRRIRSARRRRSIPLMPPRRLWRANTGPTGTACSPCTTAACAWTRRASTPPHRRPSPPRRPPLPPPAASSSTRSPGSAATRSNSPPGVATSSRWRSPRKVELARHDSRIYGVEGMIEFVVGDFFRLAPSLKADLVFLSPPWGGPSYSQTPIYTLDMLKPKDGYTLFQAAQKISRNIIMFLPRNVDMIQVEELCWLSSPPLDFESEENYVQHRFKGITAYFGDAAQ